MQTFATLAFGLSIITSSSGAVVVPPGQTPPAPPRGPTVAMPATAEVPGYALLKLRAAQTLPSGATRLPHELDVSLRALSTDVQARVTLVRPLHFGWALFRLADLRGQPLDAAGTQRALARLGQNLRVATASPELWIKPSLRPIDPYLHFQWPLEAIGAGAAWDITQGLTSQVVGVIDTGLDRNHEDLQAKDLGGYDFISDAQVSGDSDGRDADYSDPANVAYCGDEQLSLRTHGTHVSGILAASTNSQVGVAGVNWHAQLVTARALSPCGGMGSDMLDAIAWLAGYPVDGIDSLATPVRLINLSLGAAAECSTALSDYIAIMLEQRHLLLVVAAGNAGNDQDVQAPANCPGVISVGAVGPGTDQPLAPYTNFVGELTIMAPGGNLLIDDTAGVLSACGDTSNCYTFANGTSMAAPYVTGAISLMLALKPDLTRTQVVDMLTTSGVTCTGCNGTPALRIDAALALAAQATTTPPPPMAPHCPGEPCNPGGDCKPGFSCAKDADEVLCCFPSCDPAQERTQCGEGARCTVYADGTALCMPAGDLPEGASCEASAKACRAGTFCGKVEGLKICLRTCTTGSGYICRSTLQTCQQGSGFAMCVAPMTEAEAATQENCDPRRGNWDCADTWGCVAETGSPTGGTCVFGAVGTYTPGQLCSEQSECTSGLCLKGVCVTPCDLDGKCPSGFTCDLSTVPGGMCAPDSCADDKSVCQDPWRCVQSPSGDSVCALEGCSCATTRPLDGAAYLVAFALVLLVSRRRR